MSKPKDLSQHLTKVTGLNPDEREEWRNAIKKLMADGKKLEATNCFMSFDYWKQNYKK